MKFYSKLIIASCFALISVNSLNLKSQQDNLPTKVKNDFSKQWKELFTDADEKQFYCQDSFSDKVDPAEAALSTAPGRTPMRKQNVWEHHGHGSEAYLFDFLDVTLQKTVLPFLEATSKDAEQAKPSTTNDPYTLETLLFAFSQGANGNVTQDWQGNQVAKDSAKDDTALTKYIPGFSAAAWKKYISLPQLDTIIATWGWAKPKRSLQELVDRFDFDGDGRLNHAEVVLLSIVHNEKILGTPQCQKNCYDKFLSQIADPFFGYFDCDADGFINAQDIWDGLRKLKRGNEGTKYDMYNCKLPGPLHKELRTTGANDFVLKNSKAKSGMLNLSEFRTGLLLGYWGRQVNAAGVVTGDTQNHKAKRWSADGLTDLHCKDVLDIAKDKGKLVKASSGSNASGSTNASQAKRQ